MQMINSLIVESGVASRLPYMPASKNNKRINSSFKPKFEQIKKFNHELNFEIQARSTQ